MKLVTLNKINQERWNRFKANTRGFWSLWIFLGLFVVSLFAEFLANDKPLLIRFKGAWYVPIVYDYSEVEFGGEFETECERVDRGTGLDALASDSL
jgi:microcin C transport system permease protein